MTTTDYIVDILLILVIFRQVPPRPLDVRSMVLPVALVAFAGLHYLHGFPTGGNDVPLIAVLTAAGLALGALSGMTSTLWRADDGRVLTRVGATAVLTWILGMGFRFAFSLYASTAAGNAFLGRFSVRHHITGGQAWTTALVLMAFGEVLTRVAVMQVRRLRLLGRTTVRRSGPVLQAAA